MLRHDRRSGSSIGFVPTMGALHSGHARLLERASRENDFVVASIFVNPLQFDRKDDLDRYPRTLEEDLQICDNRRGCRLCAHCGGVIPMRTVDVC